MSEFNDVVPTVTEGVEQPLSAEAIQSNTNFWVARVEYLEGELSDAKLEVIRWQNKVAAAEVQEFSI